METNHLPFTIYYLLIEICYFAYRGNQILHRWNRQLFQIFRVRHRNIGPGNTLNRRIEIIEGAFHDLSADLRGTATERVGLFRDNNAIGLLDRRDDGFDIERTNGARINNFYGDTILLELLSSLQRYRNHQRASNDS